MARKTGGLGRGLDSLFADTALTNKPVSIKEIEESVPVKKPARKTEDASPKKLEKSSENKVDASIVLIAVSDIKPNSAQPRRVFDEEALTELSESIKEYGIIQPIMVRPSGKTYELVAGERRWRAARKAGLKHIPAIVRELDERQNAFFALIENMQREDLNILEEAEGMAEIIEKYGLTQEEAAKAVGKSRSYVTNALRILKLPEEIRELVNEKKLSAGHARAIAGLPTLKLQQEAAKKTVEEGWSVRQIEVYTGNHMAKKKKPGRKKAAKDVEVRNAEDVLSRKMGTKVVISGSPKRGKIELEYYSADELNRLLEILMAD